MAIKICCKCKLGKPRKYFDSSKETKDNLDPRCKKCRSMAYMVARKADPNKFRERGKIAVAKWRNNNPLYRRKSYVEKMYGCGVEELEKFIKEHLDKNGQVCEICKQPCDAIGKVKKKGYRRLVVDHDHETGKLRGIICDHCNNALGMLHDDIKIIKEVINYLNK